MSRTLPLAALALVLGFQATAQEPAGPRPGPGRHPRQERIAHRLQLTEAQKTALQELHAKHQEALTAKRKAAEAAHDALAQAMAKPESKVEELRQLHQTSANLDFELRLEHRALRQERQALLTPEQREQAARLEGRMRGRMEGRMEGRWQGMGGGHMGHGPRAAKP